jgi:hypothetical protein
MGSAILRRAFTYTCTFSWNGEMRGGRWRVLSPWAHNAGTAYNGAGPTRQDIRKQVFFAWPPPRSAVSGPGQALQDDPLPDPAGGAGGKGA